MSKLNIACSTANDTINFLKGAFNIVTPYVYYKDGELIKNFDVYLLFDDNLDNIQKAVLRDFPVFGHRRMGKDEQAIHFYRMKIEHPITYIHNIMDINSNTREDSLYLLLKDIPSEEKVVLKALNGARGIGQVLLTKDEIYKLITMCSNGTDIDLILKTFEVGAKDSIAEHEKEFLRNIIRSGDFIIQKRVNTSAEWRYVYYHGQEPMLVERNVTEKWQANTSVTGKGTNLKLDRNIPEHKEMEEIANKLARDLNVPFLSIDFYKDSDTGKIGCFEQQMQHGYAIMDKSEIVINTVNSVKSYINEHFPELNKEEQ